MSRRPSAGDGCDSGGRREGVARLLLVRHGQSTWNAIGRWQGWADPPLSELGEIQARDAAEHLREAGLTCVVASDLQRARRTAEIISAALGLGDVHVEPAFRERDVGEFSGLTRAEIEQRWPGLLTKVPYVDPPGGEPWEALGRRVMEALVRTASRFAGEVVLVATHGGVIRTLERRLEVPVPAATPNLGGRWFEVTGETVVPGEPVAPVDDEIGTAPPSR